MVSPFAKSVLALLVLVTFVGSCIGARPRILDLWIPDEPSLTYHWGGVLNGNIPVSIVWYGKFDWSQKSIINDFIYSLTSFPWQQSPSVANWWGKIDQFYLSKVNWNNVLTKVNVGTQVDKWYTMGNSLSMWQISQLAASAGTPKGGLTLVLTSKDVTVEGFCMNHCGTHGVDWNSGTPFIWVGNSETQCPGECAWPFHQPQYGPQSPPLVAPNGDVGIDGMIINIANLLAGTITNPWGNGYFQGPQEAPLEACTACAGVYGPGGFPGYPGQLNMDWSTGASYNANGVNGRKYLLPAVMDPVMSYCSTLS